MNWNKQKALEIAHSRIITYSGQTLCNNYMTPLIQCQSAEQAIRLYKNCISWALLERYPTRSELLQIADRATLAQNGVYIDTQFSGERIDSHLCCVFLNCTGWISVGLNVAKAIIPMLYLSEQSRLTISVDPGLRAPIPVETYYGSAAIDPDSRLAISDCSRLAAADNVGFSPQSLAVNPDLSNLDL